MRTWGIRAVALALALAVLPVFGSSAAQAAGTLPSVTDPRYFVGANVPWFNWGCDFGCGNGGGKAGGASSPEVRAALGNGFGRLKSAGVHTVRWWTFPGDPAQITRDASGSPTGLKPAVYADFDAALALADQYDLVYVFVLFSAPTALPRAWVTDQKPRQMLADSLAPLFERYKNNPRILAWELMNEPEWDMWNDKIPQAPVQTTMKLLADTVHAHTSNAVTIGSATLDGIPLWVDSHLDFYSPHWYESSMPSGGACARCTDAASVRSLYQLQGPPIAIGEFYGGTNADTVQVLTDLRAKGYAGAWAWSLFTDHTGDKMDIDLGAVTRFNASPIPPPAAEATPTPATNSLLLLSNWVSPTYALAGDSVTLHQDMRSATDTTVLLDFEVYDDKGNKILQSTLDNQPVPASGTSSFSTTIALPPSLAAGQYSVKVGAFSPGWGTLYVWSDSVGSFVVDTPPAPPPEPDVAGT